MPKLYPCPHCGQRTISVWRRLGIGPAKPAVCAECGRNVGVPWSALWLIPLSLVVSRGVRYFAAGFDPSTEDYLAGAIVGLVFWAWAWVKLVPLVKQ